MSDEDVRTIWWVDFTTGELIEVDVPPEVVEKLARGKSAGGRNFTERRFSDKDGIARIKASQAQIQARRDDLVNEYPQLKSQ
jgi:hypothetical protein